jgi:CDP-glycerol glycerophosphotransferase
MTLIKKIAQFLFMRLSIKETIVIDSFFGNSSDQNCVELAKALAESFDVIFVSNNMNDKLFLSGIKIIPYESIRHIYFLHTSRLLINNSRYNEVLKKRNDQTYIQLWHGIPYKKLVFDQNKPVFSDSRSKFQYLSNFLLEVEKWDIMFAQNNYTASKFRSAFLYDGKLQTSDYPSDIALIRRLSEQDERKIKQQLNISTDKPVILYAPTFREYNIDKDGNYSLTAILPIDFFKKHSQFCFLFRAHYLIENSLCLDELDNVINVTKYPQISDLYQVADALITDYSSVLFEFARTQKPIISYQEDKLEYEEKRGLYDISLENFGVRVFNQWKDIVFNFNDKSHLTNDFAMVDQNLVDHVVQISAKIIQKRK